MTDITQCPQCGTHFKITKEQRNSHQGMVRCGRCQAVFNAVENLYVPSTQLDLPLAMDDMVDIPAINSVFDPYDTIESSISISPEASARLANDFSHLADIHITPPTKPAHPLWRKIWVGGSVLLFSCLLLQIIYLLRAEIAARLPGTKPALVEMCALINCTIPLPHKIELLSIESSGLEADPTDASIITLHALLRNRANFPLAYPHIELTLTDTQDSPLARRSFTPADYLISVENQQQGFPANREATIKLHLNTTDLKPAGYRLFLFYPQ